MGSSLLKATPSSAIPLYAKHWHVAHNDCHMIVDPPIRCHLRLHLISVPTPDTVCPTLGCGRREISNVDVIILHEFV